MARIGNACGCDRMLFALSDIAVSDPEDPKTTVILQDVVEARCIGCGQILLMGRGQWSFQPISPRLPEGREILRKAVDEALGRVPA